MKKILAFVLSVVLLFSFVGCGKREADSKEVENKGKLLVGVTERMPMNYKTDGKWTGFDTEFARLFAKEKLGVEVEFVEIVWAERFEELEEYNIDCIWNGMTITERAQNRAGLSHAYLRNSQVLVTKADCVGDYKNGFDVKDLKFAIEKGSAGADAVSRNGYENVTEVETQNKALELVSKGEADATVIDSTLANAVLGQNKLYPDLAKGFGFSAEEYVVAFRKDSDLVPMLNEFMDEIRDEELIQLADKYGLTLY